MIAIWIILSLILSLLVGALSITPTPANASVIPASAVSNKSVQVFSADQDPAGDGAGDIDGDGIENNVDQDIDGDGVLNFEDPDIDGDGQTNFNDGDPADTNGFDGGTPSRPGSVKVLGVEFESLNGAIWVAVITLAVILLLAALALVEKRRKIRKKSF